MHWNATPELISAIVIVVILINSKDIHALPTSRDRMFRLTMQYTIFCIFLNILSILTVHYAPDLPLWVNMAVNTAYFTLYPCMPLMFIIYILLYVYEQAPETHRKRLPAYLTVLLASLAVYLVIVMLNIRTGWIFSFSDTYAYVRGPFNSMPLYLACFHIVLGIGAVVSERAYLDRFFLRVVCWFPFLSLGILVVQMLYIDVILTGSAMMVAILSVYLNLQTRKISIDNLTQFPNRESFVMALESIARRNGKVSAVLVSLDDFKVVNDTFGQKQGDQFIIAIANELQRICPDGRVYRYGGDELSILVETEKAHGLVEAIEERFASQWTVDGLVTRIGASIAALDLPFKADPAADPITLLDHAIRIAKNRGKRQLVYCDALVLGTIRRRNRLMEKLLQSISDDSLSLEYQPIFHLTDGTMAMAEALLRMEDEEMGTIQPSEFIPLAEELGVIGELGRWVLEQVCMMLDGLRRQELDMPVVSVNFSGQQFSDSRIVRDILEIVQRYRIPSGKINLEVTESTFIGSSFQEVLSVMEPLIGHGMHFHLDDFGTGYSNLAYVVNLPFTCIKLDKSLLWDAEKRDRMHPFIESMVKIVIQMGYQVIVEGVENPEQARFLSNIGADMGQGYWFSPPLSRRKFESLLIGNPLDSDPTDLLTKIGV